MKASAMGTRPDTPSIRRLNISPIWCIFSKCKVSPQATVVDNIPPHERAQMSLPQDNRVIGAFTPDCSDHTFCIGVLPGRARGCDDVLQTCRCNLAHEVLSVLDVSVR